MTKEVLMVVISVIIIVVLIIISSIVSCLEAAFISLSPAEIEDISQNDEKEKQKVKATKILKLLQDPNQFLSTIQVMNTLIAFINGAIGSSAFNTLILTKVFKVQQADNNYTLYLTLVTIFITLFVSYWQIIFGELVAKRVGMKYSVKMSFRYLTFYKVAHFIMFPFVFILTKSTTLFSRLFGVKPGDELQNVTEDQIKLMASSAADKGDIQEGEEEMINNIFEFNDTNVSEIMTHRTEIVFINSNISRKKLFELVANEKFTRYPVYQGTIDNVIGTIHVKDILKYLDDTTKFSLKDIIREPYFVPDSKKIDQLFTEMKNNKIHIAVVIDEYGGTAGLVTIEDLIEEILGDIDDEYDEQEKHIIKIDANNYESDGLIDLEEVEDLLEINLPIEEYDTLSGFMIGTIGKLPEDDDSHLEIDFNGYKFSSMKISDKIIEKVLITKIIEEEISEKVE